MTWGRACVLLLVLFGLTGCSNTWHGVKTDIQTNSSAFAEGWNQFKRDVGY